MELKRLRYFVAVAHELSFSKAARKLGVSQPALSRGIKELEAHIGGELFHRSTTDVSLTKVGAVLLPNADETLLTLDEAIFAARQAAKGKDSILEIAYLPSLVDAFIASAFETIGQTIDSLTLRPHEMTHQMQIEALRNETLDIAIVCQYGDENYENEFDAFEICDLEMALVVPAKSPIARLQSVDLSFMEGESFIAFDPKEFPQYDRAVRKFFNQQGVRCEPIMYVNTLQSVITAISSGSGYAIMPILCHSIASRQVAFVRFDPGGPVARIRALVRRDEKRRSVLAFLQECRRIADIRVPQITEVGLVRRYPPPHQVAANH